VTEKVVVTWEMVEEQRKRIKAWWKTAAGKKAWKRLRMKEYELIFGKKVSSD